MKVLILGANGLFGNEIYRYLSTFSSWDIFGSLRDRADINFYPERIRKNLLFFDGIQDDKELTIFIKKIKPDVIINAVGITTHNTNLKDVALTISLNSLLPHRIARISNSLSIRFIHISTDCVFSGKKGNYLESDFKDTSDLYGRSKSLGEVDYGNNLTIRISTIGYEINSNAGLLGWFLNQKGKCKGFSNAIFSGFPATFLALILQKHIIMNNQINGLFNIAAEPISKYELLKLIAKIYSLNIEIEDDKSLVINRSLNGNLFNLKTGFTPPSWPELVEFMYTTQKAINKDV